MSKWSSHPVDRLGMVRAQIAYLEDQETQIRARVAALGQGLHSGVLYDAHVGAGTSVSTDMDAVREKVGERWLARHQTRKPTVVIRVTARQVRRSRTAA